ncbi:MAG: hypothetical protein ACRDD1_05970 [Planctomycetia bacterium]
MKRWIWALAALVVLGAATAFVLLRPSGRPEGRPNDGSRPERPWRPE